VCEANGIVWGVGKYDREVRGRRPGTSRSASPILHSPTLVGAPDVLSRSRVRERVTVTSLAVENPFSDLLCSWSGFFACDQREWMRHLFGLVVDSVMVAKETAPGLGPSSIFHPGEKKFPYTHAIRQSVASGTLSKTHSTCPSSSSTARMDFVPISIYHKLSPVLKSDIRRRSLSNLWRMLRYVMLQSNTLLSGPHFSVLCCFLVSCV